MKTSKTMTSTQYKTLRAKIGTQAAVAKALGVAVITMKKREAGGKITREAELALRWVLGRE
jgi:hypothetical protein